MNVLKFKRTNIFLSQNAYCSDFLEESAEYLWCFFFQLNFNKAFLTIFVPSETYYCAETTFKKILTRDFFSLSCGGLKVAILANLELL